MEPVGELLSRVKVICLEGISLAKVTRAEDPDGLFTGVVYRQQSVSFFEEILKEVRNYAASLPITGMLIQAQGQLPLAIGVDGPSEPDGGFPGWDFPTAEC